jgi:acyl-CoA synthetase (AMP-forming)/AMP-acid ligase II
VTHGGRIADGTAIRSTAFELSVDGVAADALGLRAQVPDNGIVGLRSDDAAFVGAALIALEGHAAEVWLIPQELALFSFDADMVMLEPAPVSVSADDPAASNFTGSELTTRWVLHTSGTTGAPKAIAHTRETLDRAVVVGGGARRVWGLLYDPTRMAGIQVLLQGLLSGHAIVAPAPRDALTDRVAALVDAGVDSLSATPTLWRQILQVPGLDRWPLQQITLGGEIADQRILDALASRFPGARIVHVFASTETGAAFSVKDRRAGFPVSYLSDPPRGVELAIRDDILHVHSPGVSTSGPDGFASTGDIVEVVEDRVLFRGRASGVVNVGGANVWPEVVEAILREHPDVVDAVVSAKPNPMTGNLLVAQVELTPDSDATGAGKRLRSHVRERAPGTHVPATVKIVERLDVATTGKATR